MKRYIRTMILFAVMISMLMLSGCKRKKIPNENRGTNYKYDFMDFVDVTTFGEDGDGYIEIKTKDIDVKDFENEEEYVNVKLDLDNMDLNYNPALTANNGVIKLSKTEKLVNGEVIKIRINYKKENLKSDMNIETYDYVINGLSEAEEIDLFGENIVTFFGTEDGMLYYHLKPNNYYPQEMFDHLKYKIKTSEKLEVGKTILSITAELDDDFLKTEGYYSTKMWMKKNGYKGETETSKVLGVIVPPMEFGAVGTIKMEAALYDAIYTEEGDNLIKVCNVQKMPRQRTTDLYEYTVVYYNVENDMYTFYNRTVKMVQIDGDYQVLELGRRNSTQDLFVYAPYAESDMLVSFMPDPATREQEETVEETPEPVEEYIEEQPTEEITEETTNET